MDGVGVGAVGFYAPASINQVIGATVDAGLNLTGVDENAGVGDVIGGANVVRLARAALFDAYGLITGDPASGGELQHVSRQFQSGNNGTATQSFSKAGAYVGESATDVVIGAGQYLGLFDDPSQPPEIPQNGPKLSPEDIGPIPADVPD